MKRTLLLAACLLVSQLSALRAAEPAQPVLPIFPTPTSVTPAEGTFVCTPSVPITLKGRADKQLAADLRRTLEQCPATPAIPGTSETPGALTASEAKKQRITLRLDPAASIPDEGYTLEVLPSGIAVTASTQAGLFYGNQSLMQLVRHCDGRIPACTVTDAPRMGWRGYMLDEARHFFGMEKVKQTLDRMAELKLNVFHWHLTDEPGWRIEIKRYPKLTEVGAVGVWDDAAYPAQFYTQDQAREIIRYAADRHIMVVPEIDMPGHATAACRAYPELGEGGEGRWKDFTFNPAKEEVYQFLDGVLEEVAALFPSPYIHIGGDEVHYGNQMWFKDPQIQAFIREQGLKDEVALEHYFMRRMVNSVAAKGKTVIAWDEIVDAGISPDKAVVMWWRHEVVPQLNKALEGGYRIIMTPRLPLYFDFVEAPTHKYGRNDAHTSMQSVFRYTDTLSNRWAGREDQILGMQANLWTEKVSDGKRADYMTFPRLVAAAEVAWTAPEQKNYDRFLQKLPLYLRWLDTQGIYYFDPFDPARHPEPAGPAKADLPPDVMQ